ncbi:unnamed protein product [Calicophoron daubneyi]|uniref:Serine/threonine-protein phosphatase n=1 Tax=Calicophoron daubneyi TaxID=300641 RepID=A0AAV2TLA7_CALDB
MIPGKSYLHGPTIPRRKSTYPKNVQKRNAGLPLGWSNTHISFSLGQFIKRLTNNEVVRGRPARITESEIVEIAEKVEPVLARDPVCINLNLDESLCIIGDLYGNFANLVRIFNKLGHPSKSRYLFLGNYINRQNRSVELIILLFAYKLKYPENIFMLRGNHECQYVSYYYGFLQECRSIYRQRVWRAIMRAFNWLPAAAIIEDVIFCVHSGLIKDIPYKTVRNKEKLRAYISLQIDRPVAIAANSTLAQLTWSEPVVDTKGWRDNPAGIGWLYGEDEIHEFCRMYNFQQIIRSNESAENGYEFIADGKLLTIFAIPDLSGSSRNSGAIVHLCKNIKDQTITGRIIIVSPFTQIRPGRPTLITISLRDSLGGELVQALPSNTGEDEVTAIDLESVVGERNLTKLSLDTSEMSCSSILEFGDMNMDETMTYVSNPFGETEPSAKHTGSRRTIGERRGNRLSV